MTAQQRNANPAHRPDQALDGLYSIMRDGTVGMRIRLNAAANACRVEPLGLTGQEIPPAVKFLRNIISFKHEGKSYNAEWRRFAAAALAYWERRAKQAEIKFSVTDDAERIAAWRRINNGTIRYAISKIHRWPQDKYDLIAPNDSEFARPAYDPELALSAFFLPGEHTKKRRAKAIDEPNKPTITSEKHRRDILADIANLTQQLSPAMPQATAHTAAIPDMPTNIPRHCQTAISPPVHRVRRDA